MKIEALKGFPYAKRRIKAGDVIEVPTKHAEALILVGAATIFIEEPSVEISPRTGKPKRQYNRKGKYSTRDMVAQ